MLLTFSFLTPHDGTSTPGKGSCHSLLDKGQTLVQCWWSSNIFCKVCLTNKKNCFGCFGKGFGHNRSEVLGWVPRPFFSLIMGSFWVVVLVEQSRGKQQHSCRGLQEFILEFADTYFHMRDGKNILTYLVYLLGNRRFHFCMHPVSQWV